MRGRVSFMARSARAGCAALFLGMTGAVFAQGAAVAIAPEATAVLKRMTDYIGGLSQFSASTRNTLEVVTLEGEKLQFDAAAEVAVQRPNRLRAVRNGDQQAQTLYYDGATLTLVDRSGGKERYASLPAPATIEGALDLARAQFDLEAPGGDLLYRDAYALLMEDVVAARYVGTTLVDGVRCHHLAFRGTQTDWQLWVADGAQPYPRKMVITSKWMTGAPQFTMMASDWNAQAKLPAERFTYSPGKGAERVGIVRPAVKNDKEGTR
ncbi:MAG: DUF2092 domain-containing protein [Betaproteobacteria bacterium]|nr:DUF2092 domain-containing protein [Betaproteobacteria bacterium]